MTGPWYVKHAWDRIYLMRHDLNPATAQSECDRLNAEWEQAQSPVEPPKAFTEAVKKSMAMAVSDPLVVQPIENSDYGWCVMACGKYAARCTSEGHGHQIAKEIRASKKASVVYWTSPESDKKPIPWQTVQADLDAAWATPKSVVMTIIDEDIKHQKEDIHSVEVNGDDSNWRIIINRKWYAPCCNEESARAIKTDTLNGKPHNWSWNCLKTNKRVEIRDFVKVKP